MRWRDPVTPDLVLIDHRRLISSFVPSTTSTSSPSFTIVICAIKRASFPSTVGYFCVDKSLAGLGSSRLSGSGRPSAALHSNLLAKYPLTLIASYCNQSSWSSGFLPSGRCCAWCHHPFVRSSWLLTYWSRRHRASPSLAG